MYPSELCNGFELITGISEHECSGIPLSQLSKGFSTNHITNRITKPDSSTPGSSERLTSAIKLSEEQKKKIEANRKKALEKIKEKQQNFRDASSGTNPSLGKELPGSSSSTGAVATKSFDKIRPSIQKSSYIEYDLSTMKDSKGGFIADDPNTSNKEEKTFDEWKEEQRIVRDLPPPVDMENAPKCFECGSFELNMKLFEHFKCRVCKRCEKNIPDKYSLLTKTESREDYFLTDPELRDESILPHMEKPNPHGTFNRMQLYLRYQVEEFAFKKWGGPEGLDAEWQRREEFKVKRRDQKYEKKMKEMRKKTRAEEYNRRLRDGKFNDHRHEWSTTLQGGTNEDGLEVVKRRCIDCGFELEEVSL
ncbi:DNA repair protein [Wickerhamomyces ciferrii]|uniref:DNA repair protein n=1 Tax=Wickerhamomyces ciferrii (strain ATCC 14091 / BCRC 22168 / CBS 111 / JCM 3599 / NBRC 0793 / NRRL Y-1031 F-60-10) TaxID=1206466 RepID=K0KI80_WICCF|nr:DNA repair protein [Wickerhamomyces ciferrii]CCH41109.1 DNA repair protein [Wickerhamomyces ciferrii]